MQQARDPVCGMMVDRDHPAAESQHGGTTYYFCSENCRLRFEANPTSWIGHGRESGEPEMERHEPPRTTTGPITSPKFGSAGSGGAEFEPIPEQHDRDDTPKKR